MHASDNPNVQILVNSSFHATLYIYINAWHRIIWVSKCIHKPKREKERDGNFSEMFSDKDYIMNEYSHTRIQMKRWKDKLVLKAKYICINFTCSSRVQNYISYFSPLLHVSRAFPFNNNIYTFVIVPVVILSFVHILLCFFSSVARVHIQHLKKIWQCIQPS